MAADLQYAVVTTKHVNLPVVVKARSSEASRAMIFSSSLVKISLWLVKDVTLS